ncbi:MAG: hypothetical protein R3275_07665 [Saprospiraceae bacterium]|nr:hypothetical protein [Saprospiraceae bacterium]
MSEAQSKGRNTRLYGLYTLISIIGLVALLMFAPQWCWLAFPFVGTFMVLAFDAI